MYGFPKNDYSVPESWVSSSRQQKEDFSNGCGAGWKAEKNRIMRFIKNVLNKIIPEYIWGMYIGDICNWHDFDFTFLEKTKENYKLANNRFYHNLKIRIKKRGGYLEWLRMRRAKKCKWFVDSKLGWKAFLDG